MLGTINLNELLEFKGKPVNEKTNMLIQEHFRTIEESVLDEIQENSEDLITYKIEVSLYGENPYTTSDPRDAMKAIAEKLSFADGFRIVTCFDGPEELMPESFYIEQIDEKEEFLYKQFQFNYGVCAGSCSKYEDGEWTDLTQVFDRNIVEKEFGEQEWWSWEIFLSTLFDFEKRSREIRSLHDIVRKHIPKDQIDYCVRNWEGENSEPEILLDCIQWCPRTLREVQDFLDEINEIVLPIKEECKFTFEGEWFITEEPFAVATCMWTGNGFKILGTRL